jgi:hypothetical protein
MSLAVLTPIISNGYTGDSHAFKTDICGTRTFKSCIAAWDRHAEYADGSEVWHYENNSKVDTEVGLFLLFHVDVESEVEKKLSVAIKDGLVTDYRTESSRS